MVISFVILMHFIITVVILHIVLSLYLINFQFFILDCMLQIILLVMHLMLLSIQL